MGISQFDVVLGGVSLAQGPWFGSAPSLKFDGGVPVIRGSNTQITRSITLGCLLTDSESLDLSSLIRKSARRWYDQAEFVSTGQSYDWC